LGAAVRLYSHIAVDHVLRLRWICTFSLAQNFLLPADAEVGRVIYSYPRKNRNILEEDDG